MGYKRQKSRKLAKQGEPLDPRLIARLEKRLADLGPCEHDVRIVYRGGVFRFVGMRNVAGAKEILEVARPDCRIVKASRCPHKRWVKPEHPIARRRRVRETERQKIFGMS